MERYYFQINEEAAKLAQEMNSFRDFKPGSVTADYRASVNRCYDLAEEKTKQFPAYAEKLAYLATRYAKRLAEWMNEGFRIESMCPSILICGGGNFPTRKKDKQNARRYEHHKEYEKITDIMDRIENFAPVIRSDQDNAIEELERKRDTLGALRKKYLTINAYWSKHRTLDGCPGLTDKEIESLTLGMKSSPFPNDSPIPAYEIKNSYQRLHAINERIDQLKQAKSLTNKEQQVSCEGGTLRIVENYEKMRLQLFFTGKPDSDVREFMKRHGFRWAPSEKCWQHILSREVSHYSILFSYVREIVHLIGAELADDAEYTDELTDDDAEYTDELTDDDAEYTDELTDDDAEYTDELTDDDAEDAETEDAEDARHITINSKQQLSFNF